MLNGVQKMTKLSPGVDESLCWRVDVRTIFDPLINYLHPKSKIMANRDLIKTEAMPSVFDDFFRPWNDWFGNGGSFFSRSLNIPAVNITENTDSYEVSLAAPGMKKDDFKVDIDGNMLTISSQKEETKEEKEQKYTRKEYNYSSFSRSFSLPDEVNQEKIEARYENGVLKLSLPRKESSKKITAKQIAVK
jgi:HSP20 family protein